PAFVSCAEATSELNFSGTEESINPVVEFCVRRSRKSRLSKTTSPRSTSRNCPVSAQEATICSSVTTPSDRWQILKSISARGQDGLASGSEITFGVLERTVARLTPQRWSVRKRRSSTEIPHNSTSAPGLSAIMTHSWHILLSWTSPSGSNPCYGAVVLTTAHLLRKSQQFLPKASCYNPDSVLWPRLCVGPNLPARGVSGRTQYFLSPPL